MARASSAHILGEVPLLAGLSEDVREELAAGTRELSIRAGEWLFHEGEEAESAFVVSSGRLEVVSEGPPSAVIRALKRGEVLGEIALLHEGTRTASVRARRDSTVVELGREQFELLIRNSPEFALALTRAMGAQIAINRRAPARAMPPSTIAVVGLHTGAPAGAVADRLAAALAGHGTLGRLQDDPSRPPADYLSVLDRAEHAHERILLVGGTGDDAWTDFCLRESDLVLAVTEGEPDPAWLRRHATLRGCELLVVGWRSATVPSRRSRRARCTSATARTRCGPRSRCSPGASAGGRSGSCCPVGVRGRSPTSACSTSSRAPASRSTASRG